MPERASFTLGELREMTADLPDHIEVVVIAPTSTDDWRRVGADVSVHIRVRQAPSMAPCA